MTIANDKPMTMAQKKKLLVRGLEIRLPSGGDGIYLERMKGGTMSVVLEGDRDGKRISVKTEGIINATWD